MDSIKIASGPLADMLKQFSAKYRLGNGEAGNGERISVLCSLLSAPRTTAENWFKKDVLPTAEKARKLQLLLSLCGYEADERTALSPTIRTFIDTIVTVVSVEQAAQELHGTTDSILIWVRAQVHPKKMQDIVAFNEKHSLKRQAKIKEWKRILADNGFISQSERASAVPKMQDSEPRLADDVIVHQARALGAAICSTGVLSDDARKKAIRQAIGHEQLAELIGDLQRLSMANFNLNT